MGSKRRLVAAAVTAATVAAIGLTQLEAGAGGASAIAELRNASGRRVGVVRLTEFGDGVIVRVAVRNLTPGFHGFHIHTVGDCTVGDPAAPFLAAGGHLNPTAANHGSHAGDQPVILVNADGSGFGRFVTDRYALADLFDLDGSAMIVHAAADNYANIPTRYLSSTPISPGQTGPDASTYATGDAGARSACGVIGAI